MILGIGCDVVDLKRFKKVVSKAFIRRVYTKDEQIFATKLKGQRKINYYAKRFAAKEAVSKALGTGIGSKINWCDISVLNNSEGAPTLSFSKKAHAFILKRFNCKKFKAHISLSDDQSALAFVIIEK